MSAQAFSRGYCLDQADRPDAVEEKIALQERRIGRIDQRIFRAVEQRPGALLLQRALDPLERQRDFLERIPVARLVVRVGQPVTFSEKVGT